MKWDNHISLIGKIAQLDSNTKRLVGCFWKQHCSIHDAANRINKYACHYRRLLHYTVQCQKLSSMIWIQCMQIFKKLFENDQRHLRDIFFKNAYEKPNCSGKCTFSLHKSLTNTCKCLHFQLAQRIWSCTSLLPVRKSYRRNVQGRFSNTNISKSIRHNSFTVNFLEAKVSMSLTVVDKFLPHRNLTCPKKHL